MDASELFDAAVNAGDRRALARLLRLVEDRREGWSEVLSRAWAKRGSAHLVGVTGAPGSGKSTLTNALISAWRAVDRRVAVVAVDPSSPFSGGALLGDRIRMQGHVSDPDVFVRSMSSRGRLGGVADATAGLATLFDAARFDLVVLETVGVGQSEVDVIHHTDTVVVVVTPGWGDGVQADKAGVLEIGDIFVINKADRPEVAETRRWLATMLEMAPASSSWVPPIVETVATEDRGIDELVDALDRHHRHITTGDGGQWRLRRRIRAYIEWAVAAGLYRQLETSELSSLIEEVAVGRLDPWSAADRLLAARSVSG